MGYHGRFEGNTPKKPKKKAGKVILVFVLVLALAIGGAALWGIRYYNEMLGKMHIVTLDENLYETYTQETALPAQSQPTQPTAGEVTTAPTEQTVPTETTIPPFKPEDIINILVVGQASRAGEEGHMADSTILVTVNTYDGTVRLSSVLRDTLVSLPSYKSYGPGRNKFNMAYQLGHSYDGIEGAMAYTNLTMYHNFGVEVDHNVEVSFESFTKLIDYMGGIEIELTEAEAKYLNNDDLYVKYEVQPGLQYPDGMAALSYARMRKAEGDADSDIKRTARQQKVIETMFDKIRNLSLKELQGVADTLLPLVTTTMTPKDVADLMLKMLPHIKDLKFEKGSIPIETTYWGELQEPYGSVLLFYPDQNKRLIRAFTEGEVKP
mgnify:CR=1 FL=1